MVPFWLRPLFLLGIRIYYPKKKHRSLQVVNLGPVSQKSCTLSEDEFFFSGSRVCTSAMVELPSKRCAGLGGLAWSRALSGKS